MISQDIRYIGVNDHQIDLFESQYHVPNGMAYNSYAIVDEKTAIIDSVDARFTQEWFDHIQNALDRSRVRNAFYLDGRIYNASNRKNTERQPHDDLAQTKPYQTKIYVGILLMPLKLNMYAKNRYIR